LIYVRSTQRAQVVPHLELWFHDTSFRLDLDLGRTVMLSTFINWVQYSNSVKWDMYSVEVREDETVQN